MECIKIGNIAMLFNKLASIPNNYNILHKGLALAVAALHTTGRMM